MHGAHQRAFARMHGHGPFTSSRPWTHSQNLVCTRHCSALCIASNQTCCHRRLSTLRAGSNQHAAERVAPAAALRTACTPVQRSLREAGMLPCTCQAGLQTSLWAARERRAACRAGLTGRGTAERRAPMTGCGKASGLAWTMVSCVLQALQWKAWVRRLATAIMPHWEQACTRYASLTSKRRSCGRQRGLAAQRTHRLGRPPGCAGRASRRGSWAWSALAFRGGHRLRAGGGGCLEEAGRAMGDDAVALHLPKAQAAVPGAPLHGLAREQGHRAPAPGVDLVVHHVLQALVVGRVQEDLGLLGSRARQRSTPGLGGRPGGARGGAWTGSAQARLRQALCAWRAPTCAHVRCRQRSRTCRGGCLQPRGRGWARLRAGVQMRHPLRPGAG